MTRILQLTKKFPFPLKDGESIAVTNLSQSLKALNCEITLLSMNTIKHYVDIDSLPTTFNHYHEIHTVKLDNRVTPVGAFINLFSKDSYHVSRFFFKEYKDKLISLLQTNQYDVIQLETLYLAPYIDVIRLHSDAKIVMRSHNVEFEIWERIASNTSFLPKRWYLNYLTNKLKKFEIENLSKYDALATVTQRDLNKYQILGYQNKGISVPISIDCSKYKAQIVEDNVVSLSFIGSLDWMPNLEGLEWFLDQVWPLILDKHPDLKLHIAGRNTPDSVKALENNSIHIEGEVDDASEFIKQHEIMIVPLLSGSGMRVKILEGMALNRIVISTSIGMEGIHAKDKMEILKADSPQEFIDKIHWVMENPERIASISKNARNFIQTNFDREVNAISYKEFLES